MFIDGQEDKVYEAPECIFMPPYTKMSALSLTDKYEEELFHVPEGGDDWLVLSQNINGFNEANTRTMHLKMQMRISHSAEACINLQPLELFLYPKYRGQLQEKCPAVPRCYNFTTPP